MTDSVCCCCCCRCKTRAVNECMGFLFLFLYICFRLRQSSLFLITFSTFSLDSNGNRDGHIIIANGSEVRYSRASNRLAAAESKCSVRIAWGDSDDELIVIFLCLVMDALLHQNRGSQILPMLFQNHILQDGQWERQRARVADQHSRLGHISGEWLLAICGVALSSADDVIMKSGRTITTHSLGNPLESKFKMRSITNFLSAPFLFATLSVSVEKVCSVIRRFMTFVFLPTCRQLFAQDENKKIWTDLQTLKVIWEWSPRKTLIFLSFYVDILFTSRNYVMITTLNRYHVVFLGILFPILSH